MKKAIKKESFKNPISKNCHLINKRLKEW